MHRKSKTGSKIPSLPSRLPPREIPIMHCFLKISAARILPALILAFVSATLSQTLHADQLDALVGKKVEIEVTATGTQPFTYQWYKNNTLINGATSSTFVIDAVTVADAASYKATVTNSAGTDESDDAVLTVSTTLPPASIATQPTSKTITAGNSVTFSVTANGTETLKYQWTKGGVNISGATQASYTISAATASHAGNYAVIIWNTWGTIQSSAVTSNTVTLTVNAATSPTTISKQPSPVSVYVGQPASFNVTATGSGTLTYQWRKNGTAITGATAASYTINQTSAADAGSYSVVVTGSGGSVTSSSASLSVNPLPVAQAPDGTASQVTGGSAGTTVTASTPAELKNYAESSSAYVITLSGTVTLTEPLLVKSNKTIQGLNDKATLNGQISIEGASNVILRGLNITNANGNGITLRNATNVFITHCSVFDCNGALVEISNGSDNITVSWSEFYYKTTTLASRKALIIGNAGTETKPLHVTLHHNWWSDNCDRAMPSATYGYVHLYNNYFGTNVGTAALGNTGAPLARDNAQLLVERNQYNQVNDPLSKENLDTNRPAGRIRSIENAFKNCTGKPVDSGKDTVFTPAYSYELTPADEVDAVLPLLIGNTNGTLSTHPTTSTATISGPTTAVTPGTNLNLTAVPTGFTATSHQWRKDHQDIQGATSATYSVANMQSSHTGVYTVVIGHPSGNAVVSTPLNVTLGNAPAPDPGSSSSSSSSGSTPAPAASSGGGGGGAPSWAYLSGLLLLALSRLMSRKR